MNWFLRLKLGHKLLLTFLTCSVLTAGVGAYGLWRLDALGQMLHQTYVANVVPAQDVSEAAARLTAHSRAYVRLPALKNPDDVKGAGDPAPGPNDNFRQALGA